MTRLRGQVNGCFSELWVVQQLEKMTSLFVCEARKRNLTIKFTHTHTHTPVRALSCSSLPRNLGWWGQPSWCGFHLADRLITAELVETLAWKSPPTPYSPHHHAPSRSLLPWGGSTRSGAAITFLSGWERHGHRQKADFLSSSVPTLRFSVFSKSSDAEDEV